jgi:signal transduction histidine kinase
MNTASQGMTAVAVTRWRVLTAARVFTLATALGLATATAQLHEVAAAFLALCVLASVMSIPVSGLPLQAVAPVAEAAMAALLLLSTGDAATPLLVYLVIPPFVAGLLSGARWVILAVASEGCAPLGAMLASHEVGEVGIVLERSAPWMLVGLGLGLLGCWMHANGSQPGDDQAGYESAHRLLGQLRAVSRRLSTGLDTTALAEQMLVRVVEVLGTGRALVLVGAGGRTLSRLTEVGLPFVDPVEHDSSVERCWRSEQPQRRDLGDAEGPSWHRTVVPLRVGARMIGVVVADGPVALDGVALSGLRSYLDEHGVRLETAMLFDEVRSSATLEERHRVAREIHDGVAQEIASLGYLVDDLAADTCTPKGQESARYLRQELSRVVSELRLSIFDLRSNVQPHAGLGLALSDYARDVGNRAGLNVHLALSEQRQRLHVDVETELLRIAQEAITNARKHARATNLWVSLNTDSSSVLMRVEDDGVGAAELSEEGFGLHIMRERAERIGGNVSISPRLHGGTTVVAVVPAAQHTLRSTPCRPLS